MQRSHEMDSLGTTPPLHFNVANDLRAFRTSPHRSDVRGHPSIQPGHDPFSHVGKHFPTQVSPSRSNNLSQFHRDEFSDQSHLTESPNGGIALTASQAGSPFKSRFQHRYTAQSPTSSLANIAARRAGHASILRDSPARASHSTRMKQFFHEARFENHSPRYHEPGLYPQLPNVSRSRTSEDHEDSTHYSRDISFHHHPGLPTRPTQSRPIIQTSPDRRSGVVLQDDSQFSLPNYSPIRKDIGYHPLESTSDSWSGDSEYLAIERSPRKPRSPTPLSEPRIDAWLGSLEPEVPEPALTLPPKGGGEGHKEAASAEEEGSETEQRQQDVTYTRFTEWEALLYTSTGHLTEHCEVKRKKVTARTKDPLYWHPAGLKTTPLLDGSSLDESGLKIPQSSPHTLVTPAKPRNPNLFPSDDDDEPLYPALRSTNDLPKETTSPSSSSPPAGSEEEVPSISKKRDTDLSLIQSPAHPKGPTNTPIHSPGPANAPTHARLHSQDLDSGGIELSPLSDKVTIQRGNSRGRKDIAGSLKLLEVRRRARVDSGIWMGESLVEGGGGGVALGLDGAGDE